MESGDNNDSVMSSSATPLPSEEHGNSQDAGATDTDDEFFDAKMGEEGTQASQPDSLEASAKIDRVSEGFLGEPGPRVRGDVGLNNVGNTCFMNSGLQCLFHTPPLAVFCAGSNSFEKTSLTYQFDSLMKHAWFGHAKIISPRTFYGVLGDKYPQFKGCRQQDCQEFLAQLLDSLHEDIKSSTRKRKFCECPHPQPVAKRLKLENNTEACVVTTQYSGNDAEGINPESESSPASPAQKAQQYWDQYMTENDTVIASTFNGLFQSSVTCSACGETSETHEPFTFLSLPIPTKLKKHLTDDVEMNVTFIRMKDRSVSEAKLTLPTIATVGELILEVVRKLEPDSSASTDDDHLAKYAAAEISDYRVVRVLSEKLQLRNLITKNNPENILYVYELNDNFDATYGLDAQRSSFQSCSDAQVVSGSGSTTVTKTNTKLDEDWEADESSSVPVSGDASSTSSTSGTLEEGGGGIADEDDKSSMLVGQHVTTSSDTPAGQPEQSESEKKFECMICLDDCSKSELKQHLGRSCIICEACFAEHVKHFKTFAADEVASEESKKQMTNKCPVCRHTVELITTAFVSLGGPATPMEYITMPVIFRDEVEPGSNNDALFGRPWLIRVPSYMAALGLVEYLASINPIPEATYRLLSVKYDGQTCAQCLFSSVRCHGCEIPREGMISLSSRNAILISYTGLDSDRASDLQPASMAFEKKSFDIHDCLREFCETEHLDEQNPWYCPTCEKHQSATKRLSISKFPDYLIIHLNRYGMDKESNKRRKLNNKVSFPLADLELSEYVTKGVDSNPGKYNLYSCVCHYGWASYGHYTAYAKNPVTGGMWHYFNDSAMTARVPGENEHSSAYLLFYERQGLSANIPSSCNGPLPDLECSGIMSTAASIAKDVTLKGMSRFAGFIGGSGNWMQRKFMIGLPQRNE